MRRRPGQPRWIDSHCHVQDRYEPDDELGARPGRPRPGSSDVVCVGHRSESSRQALELAAAPPAGGPDGVGDRRPAPPRGVPGVDGDDRGAARPGDGRRPTRRSRSGSAGSTTTTSTRPGTPSATRSRRRSRSRTAHACPRGPRPRRVGRPLRRAARRRGARADGAALLHRRARRGPAVPRRRDAASRSAASSRSRTRQDVREAAVLCPLDRLLVETDSPFLAPVPHRGAAQRAGWVRSSGASPSSKGRDACSPRRVDMAARYSVELTTGSDPLLRDDRLRRSAGQGAFRRVATAS